MMKRKHKNPPSSSLCFTSTHSPSQHDGKPPEKKENEFPLKANKNFLETIVCQTKPFMLCFPFTKSRRPQIRFIDYSAGELLNGNFIFNHRHFDDAKTESTS